MSGGLWPLHDRVESVQRLEQARGLESLGLTGILCAGSVHICWPTKRSPNMKAHNLIERMFCRLKNFRRIATRYDKRADAFMSAIYIAAIITWWFN